MLMQYLVTREKDYRAWKEVGREIFEFFPIRFDKSSKDEFHTFIINAIRKKTSEIEVVCYL